MSTLTEEVLKLRVDYGRSVEELVRAGNYDYANSNITSKNFPSKAKTAELEPVLDYPGRYLESEEELEELTKKGLRPGTLQELLAFGEQHPELQRKFPIVALGSVWRDPGGGRGVGCLWGGDGNRDLRLLWFGGGWDGCCRFLAFCK